MSSPHLDDTAPLAARLGVAAGALGIAADDLARHLEEVVDGPLLHPLVWTDADVTQLGLASSLRTGDPLLPRRMTVLRAGISGSVALPQLVMARPGDVWIERWSDGRAVAALAGGATLAEDVTALGAIGASASSAKTIGERLGWIAGDAKALRLMRVTVRPQDVETYELGARTDGDVLGRLTAHADALGIPAPQLRLLEGVHAILAADRPVMVRVGMLGAEPVPGITLTYGATTIDHALRVVTGLTTRRDAAARFGTLTGALGSERIVAVELQLGAGDPVPARLALGAPA